MNEENTKIGEKFINGLSEFMIDTNLKNYKYAGNTKSGYYHLRKIEKYKKIGLRIEYRGYIETYLDDESIRKIRINGLRTNYKDKYEEMVANEVKTMNYDRIIRNETKISSMLCLCGHRIMYVNFMEHKNNRGIIIMVGSCCIKKVIKKKCKGCKEEMSILKNEYICKNCDNIYDAIRLNNEKIITYILRNKVHEKMIGLTEIIEKYKNNTNESIVMNYMRNKEINKYNIVYLINNNISKENYENILRILIEDEQYERATIIRNKLILEEKKIKYHESIIPFGKYKNKSIYEINDVSYINWLNDKIEEVTTEELKPHIKFRYYTITGRIKIYILNDDIYGYKNKCQYCNVTDITTNINISCHTIKVCNMCYIYIKIKTKNKYYEVEYVDEDEII